MNETNFSFPLNRKEYSIETRKQMITELTSYGMPLSKIYNRLFHKGFKAWERRGVVSCVLEYMEYKNLDIIPQDSANSWQQLRYFYSQLPSKMDFLYFMREKGLDMGVTIRHFKRKPFKYYEMRGVDNILKPILLSSPHKQQ